MKRTLYILFLFVIHSVGFSQNSYRVPESSTKKYMITAGYGIGTAFWHSKLENTALYDKFGGVIQSGNLKFKSRTSVRCYDINVMAPVSNIMLGLGLNFEENIMEKIEILHPNPDAGIIAYDQNFRLDKFYAFAEVPLQSEIKSDFFASVQARFGYYSTSFTDKENFFGEKEMTNTFFAGAGIIANYKVIPHVFVYLHPNFEYKYFNNNSSENPANITHNIFTFTATAGLRFDVSGL